MTPVQHWMVASTSRGLRRLRRRREDVVIAHNKYGVYAIPRDSAHRVAAKSVIDGGVYEPRTIDLLRRECGEGDIVHAGTFFGDFLPALSSAMTRGRLVHAFEPNPVNFRCARLTLDLNDIDNVALHCVGLGARPSREQLLIVDARGVARGGSSRIVREGEELGDVVTTEIPVDTIDARVPGDRHVSVLHLDVEGQEQAAMTGALATIARCRPLIVLESLPDDTWMAANLTPLGYTQTERVHHNTVLRTASSAR